MTFDEVVLKAIEIIGQYEEAAEADAGFDAGEFSGPANAMAEEVAITELATANGFTYGQVMDGINVLANDVAE